MKEREGAKENLGAVQGEAVCYGSQFVGKSAHLSQCKKCRDLRALGAKKNYESWVPSLKKQKFQPWL